MDAWLEVEAVWYGFGEGISTCSLLWPTGLIQEWKMDVRHLLEYLVVFHSVL